MPAVSIIMPAYNCEKYICEAVESVLTQTFVDWELIIIDDCSLDGTYHCMRELEKKDKRIRILKNKKNCGSAATRNYGVKQAKGKWIAFLDSDDLWRNDKLEKQFSILKKYPEAKFLFTGSAFIEDDGTTIAHVLHVPEKITRKKLLKQNVISCSSVVIQKELVLRFPMPEEKGIHEDFATWLMILDEIPQAYSIDEPLLIYRKAKSSKSGKKDKSAHMNWQTYIKAGIPLQSRIFYMLSYSVHGMWKYSLLWWRSYRLMMEKERFKNLFFMVMNASILAFWTWSFSYIWFHNYNFKTIIGRQYYFWGYVALLVLYSLMSMLIGKIFSAFNVIYQQKIEIILSHIYTTVLVNGITYIELALIGRWKFLQYIRPMVMLTVVDFGVGIIWSILVGWLYSNIYPAHEILLVHGNKSTLSLEQELLRKKNQYNLQNKISLDVGRERITQEIMKYESVMLGDISIEDREFYLKFCYEHKKRCYCLTTITDMMIISSEKVSLSDMSLQLFKNCGLTVEQRIVKRLFDICFSSVIIILLSWLYLLIGIYIKVVSGGSIFCRYECLTRDGRTFYQYKFRTIEYNKENEKKWIKGGKFLVSTHLDELPQFWNILRGEMSVVGPYPEKTTEAEKYEKEYEQFSYRLGVKAGLTGYAKIHGRYSCSKINQLSMDFYYIQNYSFALDLSILAATLKVLLEPQKNNN